MSDFSKFFVGVIYTQWSEKDGGEEENSGQGSASLFLVATCSFPFWESVLGSILGYLDQNLRALNIEE